MELKYDEKLNIWIYKRTYEVTIITPVKFRGDE